MMNERKLTTRSFATGYPMDAEPHRIERSEGLPRVEGEMRR
jgi:hypothetical protein